MSQENESAIIKPYKNHQEYQVLYEGLIPVWACRYTESSRPGVKVRDYDERLGYRTEFQRDRDDILYSPSFRQLAYKRQMFSGRGVESFFTRLTHTLIVSQIARSIARGLQLDEHLVEAIALGHDLGHTPYGHSGEDGINWFLNQKLFPKITSKDNIEKITKLTINERLEQETSLLQMTFLNNAKVTNERALDLKTLEKFFYCLPSDKNLFSHNAQSYRLLRYIEKGHRGLSLTLYTYYGILRASGTVRDDDEFSLEFEGLNSTFASFESHVVRIADDIAWSNHDLAEDVKKTGKHPIDLLDEYYRKKGEMALGIAYDDIRAFLLMGRGETYGKFITDIVEYNKNKLKPNGFLATSNGKRGYIIQPSPNMGKFLKAMKNIVALTVHKRQDIGSIARESTNQVKKICEFLSKAQNFQKTINPAWYQHKSYDELSDLERYRVICDFVSFMSDAQADQFYQNEIGPQRAPEISKEWFPLA